MKRFTLFVFLCTILVCNVLAKDVIITRDSERIDAIVTEISESEVKYKKLDNPNGPTFVLSTSKIASIMYENGDVQTFKQESQQVAQNNSDVQIYNTEPTYDIFGTANYGTVLGEMNAKIFNLFLVFQLLRMAEHIHMVICIWMKTLMLDLLNVLVQRPIRPIEMVEPRLMLVLVLLGQHWALCYR